MKVYHKPLTGDGLKEDALLKLIYVTPERITKSKLFMSSLEKIAAARQLRLIVIDEVNRFNAVSFHYSV